MLSCKHSLIWCCLLLAMKNPLNDFYNLCFLLCPNVDKSKQSANSTHSRSQTTTGTAVPSTVSSGQVTPTSPIKKVNQTYAIFWFSSLFILRCFGTEKSAFSSAQILCWYWAQDPIQWGNIQSYLAVCVFWRVSLFCACVLINHWLSASLNDILSYIQSSIKVDYDCTV